MRRTKLYRSFTLIALCGGMMALVGCESAADRQVANDAHGVGSASNPLPDSPVNAGPASPNTNGIRGEQTVGERGATGSVSSGTGSPGVAPALQRDANGAVVTPAPTTPHAGDSGTGH